MCVRERVGVREGDERVGGVEGRVGKEWKGEIGWEGERVGG